MNGFAGSGSTMYMKPSDLPPDLSLDPLRARISDEAGHCVACGLCLPHCPTYRITLSEADSPRGRIALMSGVATGRIPMNERFELHMDRCLTCRACEAACPNHVRFGDLMDEARAMMKTSPSGLLQGKSATRQSRLQEWLKRELVARPARIDALRPLLRLYRRSGLQKWMRKLPLFRAGRLALLEAQLPFVGKPLTPPAGTHPKGGWAAVYPAAGRCRGEVGLFLGCVARLTDVATLNAAIFVLNRLGYTVHVPPAQTCCGALHQHAGDLPAAAELAHANANAFSALNLKTVISTASGCGIQLAEWASLTSPSSGKPPGVQTARKASAGNFRASGSIERILPRVMDISAFLAQAEGWEDVKLAPLACRIAVHEPCTLRNVLRGSAHAYSLLRRIPGAEVVALAGNDQCCGAAGMYFLDQPEISGALLRDKIAALGESGARYLATSNVGCAMHIAGGLRETQETGAEMEVVHPVTLIARQMGIKWGIQ